jgi:hypothetical protein
LTGANTPQVVLERIEVGRRIVRHQLAQLLLAGSRPDPALRTRIELAAEALVAAAEHFGQALLTRPDSVDDDALAHLFGDLASSVTA